MIYHFEQYHLPFWTKPPAEWNIFEIVKSLRDFEQSMSNLFVCTVAADGLAPRRLGYEVTFLSLKNNLISACVTVLNSFIKLTGNISYPFISCIRKYQHIS